MEVYMETTQTKETELRRRSKLPDIEIYFMAESQYRKITIMLMGKEIASKTDIMKRNKIVSTTYFLPILQ